MHAAIIGLANSVVQLASAFGVNLTATQNAAITAVLNAALIVASLLFVVATNGKT